MDPHHSGQQARSPPTGSVKKRQRIYQHWQGNERFFFWGYLVAGPNWKASIGTALVICAPAGVFLAYVAPYMGYHVHFVLLAISCILPVLVVAFLMMTACRDPGIIPRQVPDQDYLGGTKPRSKEVLVNTQRVIIRYNDTCHFYQPPRAHHCSVNDNCIERFDHHCPWVGTTIGLRNYRTFLLFVYTSTVLCLYVFGVCVAMLFVKHNEFVAEASEAGYPTNKLWGKTLGKCIPALVLMGYTFLFFWFVGGLSVFHAYLVATNQTTYENFRYNHDSRPNPYSRGCWRNCGEVWCNPVPPSKVQFRAFVGDWNPPTGQPHSPYFDRPVEQGPPGGRLIGEGNGNGNDGAFSPETVNVSQLHGAVATMPPLQQNVAPGAAGALAGQVYGYGQVSGGAPYDPAALGQSYGVPYGGDMQRYKYEQSSGDTKGGAYNDMSAGWPAAAERQGKAAAAERQGKAAAAERQGKAADTFTSPTEHQAVGALGMGGPQPCYNAAASAIGVGGQYSPMAVAVVGVETPGGHGAFSSYDNAGNYYHPGMDNGEQAYCGGQLDGVGDVYVESVGEDTARHAHGRGLVRPEQVRPVV